MWQRALLKEGGSGIPKTGTVVNFFNFLVLPGHFFEFIYHPGVKVCTG
jgi:hypothetical protein